jgi:hypothetical protein
VVRETLATGPKTFAELWTSVATAGGGKFALRSALNKGRARGEVAFDGTVYRAATPKTKKAPNPKAGGQIHP